MRRLFVLFLLLLIGGGAVFAQETPEFRDFQPFNTFADNITLRFPLTFAQDAFVNLIPASAEVDVPEGALPEQITINFQNYTEATGWEMVPGQITVYPAATFPTDDQPINDARDRLTALLAADDFDAQVAENGIPTLNILTASPLLTASVERLEFQNGSGVRFLTAFAQDVAPITPEQVVYNFQGVTDDGNYFVSAQFSVSTSALPEVSGTLSGDEYAAFAENFENYLAEVTGALEGTDDLSPDLETLDGIIESLNIASPAAMFVTSQTGGQIDYNGIQFSYDPSLASRVEVTEVEAYVETEPGMSMFGSTPGYTQFDFFGSPTLNTYQTARLLFIPVEQFPGTDTISDLVLTDLTNFLNERPELQSRTSLNIAPIPVLPVVNAAQVFAAQPEYLDFNSGSGVRFLTYYAQDVGVITNMGIFYTFQGLTSDGRYVVAGYFPVSAPVLPDTFDYQADDFDYNSFAENYETYLEETVTALDGLEAGAFTPSLGTLDALIQSITVTE